MSAGPSEKTDVLIVGGGPSGLIASLLLAVGGVRSIVIERNAFTDNHPKAHELNARSIEILRQVGITEDELAEEASSIEDASRILFCRTINEEIGRIDLVADPQRKQKYDDHLRQTLPYLNLSQSEFEKILVRHVTDSPLVELRFAHRWDSFQETADGVVSQVTAEGGGYTVESQYLLGCDGASSRVRKAVDIEMDGPVALQSFVNAYFKLDLRDRIPTRAKLYWIIHPKYAGTFVAHHMAKRWVYAVPVQSPWEQPEDFTDEVMRQRIQGALGFEMPELEIASRSTWHMTAQIAQHYRRGRVFLVGDAAHRFPPTGGLGMNTGIADAHNLCWKLAMVSTNEAGEALLDTYETERKPVAEMNCAESHANFGKIFEVLEALGMDRRGMALFARLMHSPPVCWLPAMVRRWIQNAVAYPAYKLIGRALRDGPVRDRARTAIARQINHFDRLGLDIGYVYERGALIPDGTVAPRPADPVSEYVPTTTPGARMPHAWIGGRNAGVSTHDYLAYSRFGWWVAKPNPEQKAAASELGLAVVDTAGLPTTLFPTDQALLVRPDGHVAWRGKVAHSTGESLRRVVEEILAEPSGAPLNA